MKLIVVIFHDSDPDNDVWIFNISADSKRIVYANILSEDEPKCETLDDLAYLIWKHVCSGRFMLQESINENQIKQFLKMTKVVL